MSADHTFWVFFLLLTIYSKDYSHCLAFFFTEIVVCRSELNMMKASVMYAMAKPIAPYKANPI